ncbi:MAG: ATP-dependent DNA helicase RecG [Bacteroidales bacterium]|nr:ATP-dependent DNA helicase RecG [Bacteroidales bacterium]
MLSYLDQDVTYLRGVGPQRARLLASELDVRTVGQLLHTYPYRHEDRTRVHRIADLVEGMQHVQLRGRIVSMQKVGEGPKRRLVATFSDGTGFIQLVWFRLSRHLEQMYQVGVEYQVFGEPKPFGQYLSIAHPEMEEMEKVKNRPLLRMQPIYHSTERLDRAKITSRLLNELIATAFERLQNPLPETLTPDILSAHGLVSHDRAVRDLHFSQSAQDVAAAKHRLKFEELFYLQLSILQYTKERKQPAAGFPFPRVGECFNCFYKEHIPFALTEAQKRVIKEVHTDLQSSQQMNRLLQGDVGSGKTMVATLVALLALDNGFQACIMAPTEILAEQHYKGIAAQLAPLDIRVELLTGNVKGKRRRETLEALADGSVQIVVGTHALIEPTVRFLNLGLAIIDEQHRFGVKQRAALWEKNVRPPHVLVMTATPIPRTLAMTVYGDLDVSIIDQLPPGRKPIVTRHYRQAQRAVLQRSIASELEKGRQVYFVYPLIDENENLDMLALERGYEEVCAAFPTWKVGRVHGKMKPAEKEEAMRAFAANETQILVSTTVIEVGVNVPNASVMVVENAERFGLAQLHQLRGRVGRGAEQSYCILVTKDRLPAPSQQRMDIMVETTDGFVIAEADMKFRGPGDLEGTLQSGLPIDLKIANLVGDATLMAEAREAARSIIESDPQESLPQYSLIWQELRRLRAAQHNYSSIS